MVKLMITSSEEDLVLLLAVMVDAVTSIQSKIEWIQSLALDLLSLA